MSRVLKDLSKARILVTNDDGIHAPGLQVLIKIARSISNDVWVVAPETEQSGAGHSLSLSNPIRYRVVADKQFSVFGTPTDCVIMAVKALLPKNKKIDLLLSGINRGANVAEDITHSGTVAAAMEGTLCEIPSIALSQSFAFWDLKQEINWDTALKFAPSIIKSLMKQDIGIHSLININFPDAPPSKVKGIKVVPHGRRSIPKKLTEGSDPKGRKYYWVNWADEGIHPDRPDCDLKWLLQKYITISPIKMDLTDYSSLDVMRKAIKS
jgi:5'-nucleotidase